MSRKQVYLWSVVALLVSGGLYVISMRETLRFQFQRKQVEMDLLGLGADLDRAMPTVTFTTETVHARPAPIIVGQHLVDGVIVEFDGEGWEALEIPGSFSNGDDILLFSSGAPLATESTVAGVYGQHGAENFVAYFKKTDPAQVLKDMYAAERNDIDAEPDPEKRYVPLYLWSTRMILDPNSTALHEIVTPDTRILIPRGFGSHSNYNSIRIYSRELRRMITLSFKNGSGMPEDDVTYFLRSVQLREPTDDRATMKRTN